MPKTKLKKETCPYCEGRDNKIDADNKECFIEKENVIDMGQLGQLKLAAYQSVTVENDKYYPCITVLLTGEDNLRDFMYEKFKINFCPVCGRNLTEEINKIISKFEDMD